MTATLSLNDPPGDDIIIWKDIFLLQRCIQKAKKVVVVTGAGISVASGIPDFRSENGIFATLKRQHPKQLASGTDLFNASLFSNDDTRALFYHLTAELKRMANDATPTHVHKFVKQLDSAGKLQRVYTQNIDNLESQTGLSSADFEQIDPAAKAKQESKVKEELHTLTLNPSPSESPKLTVDIPHRPASPWYLISNEPALSDSEQNYPTPVHSPAKKSVKTVYLHGSLASLRCPKCHNVIPFTEHYRQIYAQGRAPECENCTGLELARQATEKRSMGTGLLRPTVVLYGEFHPDGEAIGAFTAKDLKARPDCLIVIGTSLKVPGIKRLVKEMAKSVHTSRGDKTSGPNRSHTGLTIYLNMDKQKGAEWDGVFDYFVQGDCQEGVKLLQGEERWALPAGILKELTTRKRKVGPSSEQVTKRVKLNGAGKNSATSSGAVEKPETKKVPSKPKAKVNGDIRSGIKTVKRPKANRKEIKEGIVVQPQTNGKTTKSKPKTKARKSPSKVANGRKSTSLKSPSTARSKSTSSPSIARSQNASSTITASRASTPRNRA